ncbi:TPA: Gfo/Idh/MocA family oxidoreductase [Candidatus Poribacteria bacterium]|nr:Gfo/Idh/MocA family oxidoreductase [Candidatus Poribacteria bacterium]
MFSYEKAIDHQRRKTMNKLRIAVIGAGPRANDYMATIKKLDDKYDFCALADKNLERANASAQKYGVHPIYTDVEKMLKEEKPDVFFALTPTDSLSVMAIMSAENKVNVIREIPIGITRQVAEAVEKACIDNGVKHEIAENVWVWPHERLKRKIVEAGLLGKILHVRLWYTSGAYHGFNAVRMLLGSEAKRVLGYVGKVEVPTYTNYGGELDNTRFWESAIIEFENDVTCLFGKPLPGPRSSLWEVEGTEGYLSGSELVLFKDNLHFPFRDIYEEIDGKRVLDHVRIDTDPPIIWSNPFKKYGISDTDEVAKATILCSMHSAITENKDLIYGAKNALKDLELCVAVFESGINGNKWIELPIQYETEVEKRIHKEFIRKYGYDPIKDADKLKNTIFTRASVIWKVAGWL